MGIVRLVAALLLYDNVVKPAVDEDPALLQKVIDAVGRWLKVALWIGLTWAAAGVLYSYYTGHDQDGWALAFGYLWWPFMLLFPRWRKARAARAKAATARSNEMVRVKSWLPDGWRTPSMIMTRSEAERRGLEIVGVYLPSDRVSPRGL